MNFKLLSVAAMAFAFAVTSSAQAATISPQTDVTATLGPDFFLDDAVTGGSDATINEPSSANPQRAFTGINVGPLGSEMTITGIGWASSASTGANDATSATVTITYLGGNETFGGGDDIVLGSVTDAYPQPHPGAGEVAWVFDTPLVGVIDGLGSTFRITITPSNATGDGSLRFKSALGASGQAGIKLSVAGTSVALVPEPATFMLGGACLLGLLVKRPR